MTSSPLTLIADAGSTKTAWQLLKGVHPCAAPFTTVGINPAVSPDEVLHASLSQAVNALLQTGFSPTAITALRYYGAGCRGTFSARMEEALKRYFPTAQIVVDSDMLAAARALFARGSGIACILGTGANSALYLDGAIVDSVPALGYILGDEASGATLGRILLNAYLKRRLPADLSAAFRAAHPALCADSAIEAVYRQPAANRYLAAFTPFLSAHRSHPFVAELLHTEFQRFFRYNIAPYARPDLPTGFVGGIATAFAPVLREAAASEGFTVGEIIAAPLARVEHL